MQKKTPSIEPLDRPEPPFDSSQKPATFYTMMGFMLGSILGIFLVSWKIINRYLSNELNKAIEKATRQKTPPDPRAV